MTKFERDLETLLRDDLAASDPGPAPIGLRAAIDAIPDIHPTTGGSRARSSLAPLVGVAAALVVLVIGYSALRAAPFPVQPGASAGGESSPAPLATGQAPTSTFDPTIEGPGLISETGTDTETSGRWFVSAFAVILLLGVAVGLRGRRAVVPIGLAFAIVAYGLIGTFAEVHVVAVGDGAGVGLVRASGDPPSIEREMFFVTARPNEPFAYGVLLDEEPGLPVTIEGIEAGFPDATFKGLRWTAIWFDREPNGGMTGPDRTFAPFEIGRYGQAVWFVGRAGVCALGRVPEADDSEVGISIRLRITVLGWPRTVSLPAGAIIEAERNGCTNTVPRGATLDKEQAVAIARNS